MAERQSSQACSGLSGYTAMCLKFRDNHIVVLAVDQDRDRIMVFGGSAEQRGSANINILDSLIAGTVLPGNRLHERIKIDDHKVYGWNAGLTHLRVVRSTATEYAAMYSGMQCLDPPLHHFRIPGVIRDLCDPDIFFPEQFCCTAG